jgi:hypothetical protein
MSQNNSRNKGDANYFDQLPCRSDQNTYQTRPFSRRASMTNSSSHLHASVRGSQRRFVLLNKRSVSKGLTCIGMGLAAALTATVGVPLSSPAKAQSAPPPVCLASTGTAEVITIIVPQARVAQLTGQGFTTASCSNAPDVGTYRGQICGLAQNAPEGLKAGFAGTYGIRPETLCSYAEEIA